ncbi:undecaprenyl-diphosphate phosphatase [Thermococcus prieurii]
MVGLVEALLSGVLVAVASVLPLSPEGSLASLIPGYSAFLVPAYLGVTFAVFFRYRETYSRLSLQAMRGIYEAELKYLFFVAVFTVLLGFSVSKLACRVSQLEAGVINLIVGIFLLTVALSWPKLALLRGLDERLPEQPSILDSLSSGVLQGLSFLGPLSRTGLVTLGLVLPGHSARKAIQWGFMASPAYFVLRLFLTGTWRPDGPVWIPFSAFLAAFFVTLLGISLLERLAGSHDRKFLLAFGLIPIIVYTLEVIM